MKQRIVVLGAGGFIGRRVVSALAASGWATPVAAVRRRPAVPLQGSTEYVNIDATVDTDLARVIEGASGIVNCVTGDAATIVNGARVLFERAARAPAPPRVVHMSSMAVYGTVTGEVDEDAPLRGDLGPYSAAKLAAEKLAASAGNIVLLRPGIVYGPESSSWCGLIGRLLTSRRIGDLGALGRGICNLVHVDDVAKAALAALQRPGIEQQAFNLGAPAAPTWNEYFQLYAQVLGAVPVRYIGPARLAVELKLLGPILKLMEIAAHATGLPPPPPPIRPWLLDLCRHQIRLRVRKAEEALALGWTPLEDGLKQAAAWFHAEAA